MCVSFGRRILAGNGRVTTGAFFGEVVDADVDGEVSSFDVDGEVLSFDVDGALSPFVASASVDARKGKTEHYKLFIGFQLHMYVFLLP